MITATYNQHGLPVRRQCFFHGIAFRQISRWLNPPVKPEKQQLVVSLGEEDPLDKWFRKFMEGGDDFALRHTPKRSYGSGEVHLQLKGLVPRRTIQQKITDERTDVNRRKRIALKTLSWSAPMVCWAMDDTHIFTSKNGEKMWIHNIKDLGSQYILPPVTGRLLTGKQVADNLRALFDMFGAPLLLKRDNGSNLCATEVDEVLKKYQVIALNSPPYYSPYNGSIEQANLLIKSRMRALSEKYDRPLNEQTLPLLAALAAHEENAQCKRSVGRRTPSYCFFTPNKKRINDKTREEVANDINEHMECLKKNYSVLTKSVKNTIKRKAVEAVLEKRSYIKVVENERVSPLF
jgi:transposase InsO family protein